MFSKKDIQQLANSTSYQRGQSYFNSGSVKKLKRHGNVFEAVVHGSEKYDVSLTLDKKENIEDYDCDCPYDYDGACKHVVAVGLAVLDQMATSKLKYDIAETVPFEEIKPIKMTFAESFEKADDTQKNQFLNQLLQIDISLQQAFVQFMVSLQQPAIQPVNVSVIDKISTEVYEALSDLSFDEDTLSDYNDDDNDYHYYEYGYNEDAPDTMVEEVLEPYKNRIEVYLNEGRLIDAFTTWLGVYEGILATTEPEEDDFDIVSDYVAFNTSVWERLTQNAIGLLTKRPYNTKTICQLIDLLTERYVKFEVDGNDTEAHFYDLKNFEKLLITLVNDKETATYLKQQFEAKKLIDVPTLYVMLHVARILNDTDYWVKISEDHAQFDVKVATELLVHYITYSQRETFKKTATRLFPFHKDSIDDLVFTTISHADEPALYVDALRNYTTRKSSIKHYKQLQPYLSDEDRKLFVDKQKDSYKSLFYVELLEVEQRNDDMLAYLNTKFSWHDSNSAAVLSIAAKYFPGEAFGMVEMQAEQLLDSGQRGRGVYSNIALWLSALKSNPDLHKAVLAFTKALVTEHSRLPALKDELRNQKLSF
jgi:SWIM zinc finger